MTDLREHYQTVTRLHEECCRKRREDTDRYLDLAVRAMQGRLTDVEQRVLEHHANR